MLPRDGSDPSAVSYVVDEHSVLTSTSPAPRISKRHCPRMANGDTMDLSGTPVPELDLHRLTVDEALPRIDEFLYDAYVARRQSVRIVHGKGTGALRNAVRTWLPRHQLVKSFRWAEQEEGGGGVTVVNLVD